MIKSMTGFAQVDTKYKEARIHAEIKTLNNKYLDVSIKLPNEYSIFEDKVRKLIAEAIKRGKVNVNVALDYFNGTHEAVVINRKKAKTYYNKIKELSRILKVSDSIKISDILFLPGVIETQTQKKDTVISWNYVEKTIKKAISKVIIRRICEGRILYLDICKQIKKMAMLVEKIEKRANPSVDKVKQSFSKRVQELVDKKSLDNSRIETEAAIYAKNCDIHEEITRIKSHIDVFESIFAKEGSGKKLDFLAQELQREFNTIGSKSNDYRISQFVIAAKSEIEKIREQAKNIE